MLLLLNLLTFFAQIIDLDETFYTPSKCGEKIYSVDWQVPCRVHW